MRGYWAAPIILGVLVLGILVISNQFAYAKTAPVVNTVNVDSHPPIPAGSVSLDWHLSDLTVSCNPGPDTFGSSTCPVLSLDGFTYWAYSYRDNRFGLAIVKYSDTTCDAMWEKDGARYLYKITVDETAQTVTFWGQADNAVVMSWDELRTGGNDCTMQSTKPVNVAVDGTATKATLQYSSSYNKMQADADASVTVQSEEHLYNPGDQASVEGTISSGVIAELGESLGLVTITVTDANGQIIAEEESAVDASGKYFASFTIPDDTESGQYTITSKLKVDADVLGLLGVEVTADLVSSARFLVASQVRHEISVDDNEFEVFISSNSQVRDVEFEEDAKKVSFVVEGETGTQGVAEVTIPTAMLSGEMTVLIDGQVMASDDVMVKSNAEAETTLELNYDHSAHTIDVVGTQAVPEFSFPVLAIMVVGTIVVILLARTRTLHIPKI